MKIPLVSIIVPVYNTEEYMLDKCFSSIFNQTMKDFELIVVDDGSEKKTADFLDEYFFAHPEVILLHNFNGGASVARNTGIEKATGKYITFVDADDWVDPDYLDFLTNNFDETLDIVMCTRLFEYKKFAKENHFFNQTIEFDDVNRKELIFKSITTGVAGTWCKIYRRDFIDKNHLQYDSKLRRTQDIIFNLYAFQNAKKILYIDKCMYHYRMQNDSVTKKFNPKADEILTLAAEEFVKYVGKYYHEDNEIITAVNYKCLIILNEIFKLKLFNPMYKISKLQRLLEVIELCELPYYKNAINKYDINNYPSTIGKLKLHMLKRKKYGILRLIYRFQFLVQQRRNY